MKTTTITTKWAGNAAFIRVLALSIFSLFAIRGMEVRAEAESEEESIKDLDFSRSGPKELSINVTKGLDYLVSTQQESGGWGQGGGWRTKLKGGRVQGANVSDPADIGNTAVALLAFIRSGHDFSQGKYSEVMKKGAKFLLDEIAKNKDD